MTKQESVAGRWIAHWRYEDGSGSGVLPRVLTDYDKTLLELAEKHLRGFGVIVKYVEIDNGRSAS